MQSQNTWLNTELKAKTDELLVLAREKGNEILELKCNLENKKEEVIQNIIFICNVKVVFWLYLLMNCYPR